MIYFFLFSLPYFFITVCSNFQARPKFSVCSMGVLGGTKTKIEMVNCDVEKNA